MNAYKLDFVSNVITITADFAKAMNNPDSEEYKIIAKIRRDFPEMEIVRKTHKTPSKYRTKDGKIFNCNQFKNLTYENMETFMMGLPNGEEYMNEYLFLRNHASDIQTNGYTLIRRWFVKQFPDYQKNPLTYIHTQPEVVSAAEAMADTAKAA